MRFVNLSAVWVVAGLAALAATLFALQRLRTRYRDVTVVTTLFWRQVIDEAPVRTLRSSFRHPWAYLLFLTIASLIWIASAEPEWRGSDERTFHVLVLDGSAGMAAGSRFAEAVADLERDVARLPRPRRQVIWSGARIRSLLGPGEHEVLLARRLKGLAPEAAPSSLEQVLRDVSARRGDFDRTAVLIFGDAPVRPEVMKLVPATVTVRRASGAAPLERNTGITALGVADSASGAWDRVDVLVGTSSTADRAAATAAQLELGLDGQPLPVGTSVIAGAVGSFAIRDLPASGGLFTARLTTSDGLPIDDQASLRLPLKPIVKVALSASLAPILGPVLEADAGVVLATDDADVVIRREGEAIGVDLPALELVRSAVQSQAFLFTHPESLETDAVFASAVADVGLTQIDAMSLAESSGRTIEVSMVQGRFWRFSVWEELLSDQYDFTRSRAFPLFVGNAVRWLSGAKTWYPRVAAGRPLSAAAPGRASRMLAANGRRLDPIGPELVPAAAGELQLEGGDQPLAVSLLDVGATTGQQGASIDVTPRSSAPVPFSATTWLTLVAIGLLAFEWFLFQRNRVP